MLRRLRKSRGGTAEIVGTVLFLVILFFFFSNVFLWHNQATQEMDQVIADKTNSAVRIETAVLPGTPVNSNSEQIVLAYGAGLSLSEAPTPGSGSLALNVTFMFYPTVNAGGVATRIDTAGKQRLVADLRLSINASYVDPVNEPCFVYIWDYDESGWVNTALMVTNGFVWSNTTLSDPSSYINGKGLVMVGLMDASSQMGYNDTAQGFLNIASIEVCADSVALEVTNLGGSEAALSRLWIINATQTADSQTDHVYADLNGTTPGDTIVAGGSTLTIMLSDQTQLANDSSVLATDNTGNWTLNYAPPPGGQVIFRVLTTLGNTAACSYNFP